MRKSIEEMTAELAAIAALPNDEARALPGYFYTDPDYFDYEMQTVLASGWHCLGRADEIPKAGDYFTTHLFNEPMIIVRDDEGDIRALSNICRHRNMQVAKGSGHARAFICSYHAWRYDRRGALLTAPTMDKEKAGLKGCTLPSFPCEIWNGFIYVSLDDNPEPLSPRLEGLKGLLANYEPERMRFVDAFEDVWHVNWKCLIENFMEAYHLSVVHPKTLHPYTPTNLSKKAGGDSAFTAYAANYPETADLRGDGAPGLTPDERKRSTLFCVFPTHLASQAATLLVSFYIQPLAVDRIRVRWTMSTYDTELSEDTLKERIALWHEVNEEDREKLERLQVGLSSKHAGSGPLAHHDLEGTIKDFYGFLA